MLSVIVPVYNVEKYLAECLDSTKQCVVNGNIKNNTLNITKIKNN